ncbi:MAG: right-handed parallel beta-helix repeat-containing protein [Deltaproteobacteria bacterium]|nr:right-handed parallel beta-helix repeat-containing protein [Deltaproteobacteria bacterium]
MKERSNLREFGLVVLICLLLLFPTSVWAADRYVDIGNETDGDGTSGNPWKYLHTAIPALNPGDVLHVAGGTYSSATGEDDTELLIIEDDGVTIQGDGAELTIIDGLGSEGWDQGIKIAGSYVIIKDLAVTNFEDAGILIYPETKNITGNIIEGCKIHDNSTGIRMEPQIEVYTNSNNIIRNNCEIYNNETGISIDGSDNNEIYGNQIYDNPGSSMEATGIEIWNGAGNNLIHNNDIYWSGDDYQQEVGIALWDTGDDNQVYQNKIHGHSDIGIYVENCSPKIRKNRIYDNNTGVYVYAWAGTASPSIWNNLIYDTGATMGDCIYVSAGSGSTAASPTIYHNTIHGGSWDGINIYDPYSTTSPDIRYNIITNFGNSGINYETSIPASPFLDYNDVWNNAGGEQNYVDWPPGENDIQVDPRYASYELQSNSPCIDAIPGGVGDPVTDDFDGNSRPHGSGYDMGAYEFAVSTTETVPIPPGIEIADYVMISFTVKPDDPACTAVFGPEMGGSYDQDDFRFGRYKATLNGGSYEECGSNLQIVPGRAFWAIARNGVELTVDGPPASLGDTEVPLLYNSSNDNGWNQIGCPNPADYAWGDVQVLENGAVMGAISDLPSDNEWIDKRLWCWENGSYDPNNDFMEQGEGYWVRAKKGNVSLKFLQINQDPEMEIAQLSNSSIMFAGLFNKAKRWMKEWVFSPKTAIASSDDSPPMPMGVLGASETASADTAAEGDGGGGCFVDAVR